MPWGKPGRSGGDGGGWWDVGGAAFRFEVNWSVASSDAMVRASCLCDCEWAPGSVTRRLAGEIPALLPSHGGLAA